MELHSLSVVNVSVLNQVLGCNLHQSLVKKKKRKMQEVEKQKRTLLVVYILP